MANDDAAASPANPPPEDEATPEYREWLAAAYDTDVYQQWLKPFEDLLHRRLETLPKGMALEIGCATGRGTERLMNALGDKIRLVAQEDRNYLLDLARARLADQVGSRLFFNSDQLPRLRYDGKVFASVVANLSWWERTDRAALLAEMVRVLDDEGQVVLTAPLAGTFSKAGGESSCRTPRRTSCSPPRSPRRAGPACGAGRSATRTSVLARGR